ncbi:MAG: MFS transporter [Sphingomonas sp.]|uniref:MFS transporter n=1 Tax=Sphingomonas sp. TaxID=28214 RepID=UPI003F80FCE1
MTDQRRSLLGAYIAVTTLFFAWGFITSLVDPLVASVKGIFRLSDVEAQLAAFAFFIAYGVTSFPAARLLSRFKPVQSILLALGMMIAGCLLMLLAANIAMFPIVLLGLFVLASGITILQVAANPLSAALGDPKYSHLRLTLSQTFNSFGTFIGPLIGAHLFLKGVEVKSGAVIDAATRAHALAGIDRAYFWICGLIGLLALFFFATRAMVERAAPHTADHGRSTIRLIGEAFASRWAVIGGIAIFLYVGAEVSIGTQMALFLNSDAIWGHSNAPFAVPLLGSAMGSDGVAGVSLEEAGKAVAFYWGGAMVGRALGSALLGMVRAYRLLALFAAAAALMCLYVALVGGVDAGFVALAIGLVNSIMFPVTFTLTLERSSASEEATSGLLCTAIIGGAFVPLLVGLVSQSSSYATAFVVPMLCYVVIGLFALSAARVEPVRREDTAALGPVH